MFKQIWVRFVFLIKVFYVILSIIRKKIPFQKFAISISPPHPFAPISMHFPPGGKIRIPKSCRYKFLNAYPIQKFICMILLSVINTVFPMVWEIYGSKVRNIESIMENRIIQSQISYRIGVLQFCFLQDLKIDILPPWGEIHSKGANEQLSVLNLFMADI